MSAEEERLRREIARGAGLGTVERLVEILRAKGSSERATGWAIRWVDAQRMRAGWIGPPTLTPNGIGDVLVASVGEAVIFTRLHEASKEVARLTRGRAILEPRGRRDAPSGRELEEAERLGGEALVSAIEVSYSTAPRFDVGQAVMWVALGRWAHGEVLSTVVNEAGRSYVIEDGSGLLHAVSEGRLHREGS